MDQLNTEKLWIIDTDYSYDDQLALSMLINKLNIVAITVVGSIRIKPEIIKLKIEDDLINIYKNDKIKVYAGVDRPYVNYQEELNDEEIFDSYNIKPTDYSPYEKKEFSNPSDITTKLKNNAAIKIAELVESHPEEINILTLGRLTNISLATSMYSHIKNKINGIYIVGGSYNNHGNSGNAAEFNFRCDPIAAKNVINYCSNINLIPLEIEKQMNVEDLLKKDFNSEIKEGLEMIKEEREEEVRGHHSLLGLFAALIILYPSCVKTKVSRPCDVDIIGRHTRGAMVVEKYDHVKSGKLRDIIIYEEIDFKSLLDLIHL